MHNNKKIIVIGAGVAGLATAIRLAHKGFDVTIYEKNDYIGGKLSAFKLGNFSFDAGPSLFTAPQYLIDVFNDVNEDITPFFSYEKVAISCQYFYPDNTTITAHSNSHLFANELALKHGEDAQVVENYLQQATTLYNNTGSFFISSSLHKIKSFINPQFLKAFSGIKTAYVTSSLHKYNTSVFKNAKTVQLFNRYATYNGSNPYKAPAMLSMIPHLEHNNGTFYPKGGMVSIANALHNLAIKKGVTIHLNSHVDNIINCNNAANGIVVNNKNIIANAVVANIDAFYVYKKMLKNTQLANKISKQQRSSSALVFYWGINKNFDQLGLHNIIFSDNYKAEFDAIFGNKNAAYNPTIYINITSKCQPNYHAPANKENWFVMINVPSNTGQNWQEIAQKFRAIIVEKISKTLNCNIEELIEIEKIMDPILIDSNTASYQGSLYGTSSNSKFSAFLRHPNFSKKYKNLFFVGGSVHPGGGIPLCLKSAAITSKIIEQQLTKNH
jgi:phytoene desaturase